MESVCRQHTEYTLSAHTVAKLVVSGWLRPGCNLKHIIAKLKTADG